MLITAVALPEAFAAVHFSDPTYHLNTEILLRGIGSNGLILVDSEKRLYEELFDNVDHLATLRYGKTTHALFEELLKKQRQKIVRFVTTCCSVNRKPQSSEAAVELAGKCNADAILVDSTTHPHIAAAVAGATQVISIPEYIGSTIEAERHRYSVALLPIDEMPSGEFEQHMIRLTRFTKRLRFYDKQIGKGSSLGEFCRGIGKIMKIWLDNAYFSRSTFTVEIYTCVQKTYTPTNVVHNRIVDHIDRHLAKNYNIPVTFYFKDDSTNISHDRYLQTDSLAVYFSKGFDYLNADDSLQSCSVKLDNGVLNHLQNYRNLTDVVAPTIRR
jgi:hypothetical protein